MRLIIEEGATNFDVTAVEDVAQKPLRVESEELRNPPAGQLHLDRVLVGLDHHREALNRPGDRSAKPLIVP